MSTITVETLQTTKLFALKKIFKFRRKNKVKAYFQVEVVPRLWPIVLGQMRDYFDPDRTRGSKDGLKWRFDTQDEAEQKMLFALLMFKENN